MREPRVISRVVIGYNCGLVQEARYFQNESEPEVTAFTPEQARVRAEQLVYVADAAERDPSDKFAATAKN